MSVINKMSVIKEMKTITDTVIVRFSTGVDSICCLDLCMRNFKNVHAYFGYIVKGLSFQEDILQYYEKRYNITIDRIPCSILLENLSQGVYCIPKEIKILKEAQLAIPIKKKYNCEWLIDGFKKADGIQRFMAIKVHGHINHNSKYMRPVAYWNKADVWKYIKQNKLPYPPEYDFLGYNWQPIDPKGLYYVWKYQPQDWPLILKIFPFAMLGVQRYIDVIAPMEIAKKEATRLKRQETAKRKKLEKEMRNNA